MKLSLNTGLKTHAWIGLFISLWLVFFLILIAPFDIAELSFQARLEILPVYGIITFINYLMLIPIQNVTYRYTEVWLIKHEVVFLLVFNLILLGLTFLYYKSDIVNGNYGFQRFGFDVYLPICLILLPIIIGLRWFFRKKTIRTINEKITLTGDNKLDVIQLDKNELISVSSADNYIEVNYILNNVLKKTLLRNTLTQIQKDVPFLIKIHRSHLINPFHFKSWKDSKTMVLTQKELPVSKKYKTTVLSLIQSSQKSDALSQTL